MVKNPKGRLDKAKIFSFVPTGEYYFNRGIKAYDRFDMKKAKKYLQRALELEPFEPIIACQLAIVHTETGEYEKSNQLLLHILAELDEEMTECHYFLANNFAHMGMFTEAYKYAELYLEQDKMGEFTEEAKELLDLIGIEEDVKFDELVEQDEMIDNLEAAKQLLESGDFSEAVELLEQTVANFPELWSARNNLALAYYYEGQTEKAFHILEEVLKKSPGNLHALCNLAVFLFYEDQTEQLEELLSALDKVQPIHFEHRYKLGATFAVTGRYEQAYQWLRQIQSYGYEGDAAYYYWLTKSAYYTNRTKVAAAAWEKLVKINPEQAVVEPWKVESKYEILEEKKTAISKWMRSKKLEERLYALFLLSLTHKKCEILAQLNVNVDQLTHIEKKYITYIFYPDINNLVDSNNYVLQAHDIAFILYKRNQDQVEKFPNLLNLWFELFVQLLKVGKTFNNQVAIAAATEYIWFRERDTKKTQSEISTEFNISTSTLRKYIRLLDSLT
ncbi:tetratricopeptide repeat protein [Bacillus niameyensis]|uniref:tetratricopeptide repeat protein n=1 Tax=Bacillus niameyensis TaxID=1522308 RepID=UPI000783F844|nr:tetratricopeptide repeat protein [Bacillus niameyensis]